jgi:hypothetical protein
LVLGSWYAVYTLAVALQQGGPRRNMTPGASARRLHTLEQQLSRHGCGDSLLRATAERNSPVVGGGAHTMANNDKSAPFYLTDEQVAAFIRDGFVVLPNLVEAGDIDRAVCDEIFELGYAQRDLPGMGQSRTELFSMISASMNKVLASPTLRGGLESLLGPGYFMPAWNTHLHINGTGDGGFHADGTDHGPTQVRNLYSTPT